MANPFSWSTQPERSRAESPIDRIVAMSSLSQIPGILKEAGCALLEHGAQLDVLPVNLFFRYRDVFKAADAVDLSTEIRQLRAVKSAFEIALIRQAAQLSDQVAARFPELIREGMTEVELAGQVEAEARRLGHQGVVRMRLWGGELFYGHLLGPRAGCRATPRPPVEAV
jgi:Xaa-Pro aminopeptidase